MTVENWLAIIAAIGTAVTGVLVAVIPLLISELRKNTRATQASTDAVNVRAAQSLTDAAPSDPAALLRVFESMIQQSQAPKSGD